ncbi:branched-chain amino acid transaminase [Flavihumibacter sp. R14]|nr:branched-chain amino acid transaminase [Flavihumibacter soli]
MQYYNSETVLYLNGKFLKAAETQTDLYGQSLHYGYGVFEGIRAYQTHNGIRVFKAKEHFERLKQSCELINIPYEFDNEQLIDATYKILEVNHLKNAYIRPLVFCSPNMSLTRPAEVSVMICAWDWGAYLGNNLLKVCISSFQRPNPKSVKVEAKATGHYVNSILATTEAKDKGYDEALLLDMHENIAEAPGANFFLEKDGCLFTPPPGSILPGITRATVFEIGQILGIPVFEKTLTVADIQTAQSAFFCGTAAEIVGIKSIDDKVFVADWKDTLGATIQRTYKNLVLEKENYEVII